MMKSDYSKRVFGRPAAAMLGVCVATAASIAGAQTQCVPPPKHIPAATPATAMPNWPAEGASGSAWVRPEVSDARWSSSALINMVPEMGTDLEDQARFRFVRDVDANELAVSIQLRAHEDDSALSGSRSGSSNEVWFGVAPDVSGSTVPAVAIRIPTKLGTTGEHIDGQRAGFQVWLRRTLADDSFGWEQAYPDADNPDFAIDEWVTQVQVWNPGTADSLKTNGAEFAAELKVQLANPALNIGTGTDLRIMTAVDTGFGAIANNATGYVKFASPDPAGCTGCLVPGTEIIADPTSWIRGETTPADCIGVRVDKAHITSRHSATSGGVPISCTDDSQCVFGGTSPDGVCVQVDPDNWTCRRDNNCGGRNHCLSSVAGDINYFSMTPDWSELGADPDDDFINARFRISSWGTNYDASQWLDIVSVANSGDTASSNCDNGSGGLICDQNVNVSTPVGHQCMLVELEPGAAAPDSMVIANGAEYVNTRFEQASLINVLGTINLKGMPDYNPDAPNHEVMLRVVKVNMPTADSVLYEDDIPAWEATRAQVDREFASRVGACSTSSDYCLPLVSDEDGEPTFPDPDDVDQVTDGTCAALCDFTADEEPSCAGGRIPTLVNEACLCLEQEPEQCTFTGAFPEAGGYNPLISSLTESQIIDSTYASYLVYPYVVTGNTEVADDGTVAHQLIPLPRFGVHGYHEGEFYGWLTDIVYEDGGMADRLRDDVYRIEVPKTTDVATIRLLLSAEEPAHPAPLSDIAGTSTLLGFGLGNVFMTGVSPSTGKTVDLTQSELVVQELLKEGNAERVTNLNGPKELVRLPGATPVEASFLGFGPEVSVTVVDLLGLGYVTNVGVIGASVKRPSSCGFFFGSANLSTAFELSDGATTLAISGQDQWTCYPFELVNL